MRIAIRGRIISKGVGAGEALVTTEPISFLGGIDPENGRVIERGHELEGKQISGKVLVFPKGKGSTVGSWIILRLAEGNIGPAAIINVETEPIVAVGAILGGIPLIDKLEEDPTRIIATGDWVRVDANSGVIELVRREYRK